MFEAITTSISKPESVDWYAPTKMSLAFKGEEKANTYYLSKGAMNYLHKQIDLKPGTSKEVYKKAENVWKQLRDTLLDESADVGNPELAFRLEKPTVLYLTLESGDIVDVADFRTEESVAEFEELHQQFILDITTMNRTKKIFQDCKSGLVKLVFYDKDIELEKEPYTPVVIVEMNHDKSTYKAITGILIYKNYTYIPSFRFNLDMDSLVQFILNFDLEGLLYNAKENSVELYESYQKFQENQVEISVRELTTLMKKVGYEIEAATETEIKPLENFVYMENSQRVQDFYNKFRFTTGDNVVDLINMSDFRKTFRYNQLTILDMLEILSKEYSSYESGKITIDVLGDIVYKLYDTTTADKSQVKTIEREFGE